MHSNPGGQTFFFAQVCCEFSCSLVIFLEMGKFGVFSLVPKKNLGDRGQGLKLVPMADVNLASLFLDPSNVLKVQKPSLDIYISFSTTK
jgi:hypothetical protein